MRRQVLVIVICSNVRWNSYAFMVLKAACLNVLQLKCCISFQYEFLDRKPPRCCVMFGFYCWVKSSLIGGSWPFSAFCDLNLIHCLSFSISLHNWLMLQFTINLLAGRTGHCNVQLLVKDLVLLVLWPVVGVYSTDSFKSLHILLRIIWLQWSFVTSPEWVGTLNLFTCRESVESATVSCLCFVMHSSWNVCHKYTH